LKFLAWLAVLAATVVTPSADATALPWEGDSSAACAHALSSEGGDRDDDRLTGEAQADFVSQCVWPGVVFGSGLALERAASTAFYGANLVPWPSAVVPTAPHDSDRKTLRGEPGIIDCLDGPERWRQPAKALFESTWSIRYFHILTNHCFYIADYSSAYLGTIGAKADPSFGSWTLDASEDLDWALAAFNRA